MTTTPETITRALVPERQRADFVEGLFGINFPMQLEPCIFATASELSSDYQGGYWHIYALGNRGAYLAPDDDAHFTVRCENGFDCAMTADAFGITVCLYAFSRLSFVATGNIVEAYTKHYYWLREYAMDHAEAAAIIAATD